MRAEVELAQMIRAEISDLRELYGAAMLSKALLLAGSAEYCDCEGDSSPAVAPLHLALRLILAEAPTPQAPRPRRPNLRAVP